MGRHPILLALLLALAACLTPAAAWAQVPACPSADPTYTGNCGPTFVLPAWGDAGGWTDPSQYSTIQLADVDGDGRDELLGRSDAGIQVHVFDTTLGQWRPQVDTKAIPLVLSDFSSSLPSGAATWTEPQYYSTIQTADIDGQPGEEILARFPDGMRVYKYTAASGWTVAARGGPFSDADGWGSDPSLYSTIQTADLSGDKSRELISRSANGIVAYRWTGSGWTQLPTLTVLGNNNQDNRGQQPAYYSDIAAADVDGKAGDEVVVRTVYGAYVASFSGNAWSVLERGQSVEYFSDFATAASADCPFNPQTTDCFGSSPSYYETMQLADVDGQPGAELLGRQIGGLAVRLWGGTGGWRPNGLPLLTDLAGPGSTAASLYGTIQTAQLDGTGGREVLALTANGVQAWSYSAATKSWTRLAPSTPLALNGNPWQSDASTFSTIQSGDVDGDGRDDVIARGPYGVRTWFYDRRTTGGWERYLADGYPAFSTAGQVAAFAELNTRAKAGGYLQPADDTARDAWAGETPPSSQQLTQLQTGVTTIGNCSGPSGTLPITYKSCVLPPGSSGFNADDWTAVVNEILTEIFWAQQVLVHFDTVASLNNTLYIGADAQFPAIGADLGLAAAAATQTEFDLQQAFAAMTDVIGAIAGLAESEELSGLLTITADVMSMVPSSTPTLTDTFDTTYAGVAQQFANSVSEAQKAVAVHSQAVRSDLALITLVGQLVQRGTWNINTDAATSAGRWGFALWAYQSLLPAFNARYVVTQCNYPTDPQDACSGPGPQTGVIGGVPDFTAIGASPQGIGTRSGTPCQHYFQIRYSSDNCQYTTLPANVLDLIWGDVSPTCDYRPGNAGTVWTFGCSLGVNVAQSVGQDSGGWKFSTYYGNYALGGSASFGAPHGNATVTQGRPAIALRAAAQLRRNLNLRRARISVGRLLHERGGLGELVRPSRGRRTGPVRLSPIGRPRAGVAAFMSRNRRLPSIRLVIDRRSRSRPTLRLTIAGGRAPLAPGACNALPASLSPRSEPVPLETRLRIADGRDRPIRLVLRALWRCRRDAKGNITRMTLIQPKPLRLRPGLRLRARGPRTVRAGGTARFSLLVQTARSRRRGAPASGAFYRTTLFAHPGAVARLAGRPRGARRRDRGVTWSLGRLRDGDSQGFRVALKIPPETRRRRVCGHATVSAMAVRPASARLCMRVRAR